MEIRKNNDINTEQNKDKVFVVGWTYYDDEYFEDCEITDEVFDAVVKEVRERGYKFGGNSHQDSLGCCPVMNNGRCARFSCRGWGAVIAAAYNVRGADGKLDHLVGYMDEMIRPEAVKTPPSFVNYSDITDDGVTYKMVMPAGKEESFEIVHFEARAFTDELASVKKEDYIDMYVYIDEENNYFAETYKVKEIFRAPTFEEAIVQAEEDYDVYPDEFGYEDIKTKERLIEQLYKDYPRETVEKQGVVLYRIVRQL